MDAAAWLPGAPVVTVPIVRVILPPDPAGPVGPVGPVAPKLWNTIGQGLLGRIKLSFISILPPKI